MNFYSTRLGREIRNVSDIKDIITELKKNADSYTAEQKYKEAMDDLLLFYGKANGFTIDIIEAMNQEQAQRMGDYYKEIKGHDCYFVDFGGYFGYSVLVFKNEHHIYYANDYELHHRNEGKTHDELREMYTTKLTESLFTMEELLTPIKTYAEYRKKSYFLHNYWIQQYDHQSAFYIGEKPKLKYKHFCTPCFAYVPTKEIAEEPIKTYEHLVKEFYKIKTSDGDVFKEMIRYELYNHEACVNEQYDTALDSLGLSYEKLTKTQKAIVSNELERQCREYWERGC